jgi:hypothetical protein
MQRNYTLKQVRPGSKGFGGKEGMEGEGMEGEGRRAGEGGRIDPNIVCTYEYNKRNMKEYFSRQHIQLHFF